MVEHVAREALYPGVRQIRAQPLGVQSHLVHADQADGGEMVAEGSEVPLRIGIKSLLQKLGDDRSLGLQAAGGQIHEFVQTVVEIGLIRRQVSDSGHVDGHDADGTG